MNKNFCEVCGTKLGQTSELVWHCSKCSAHRYANPKPCVDIALFDENNHVLMAVRAVDPDKGKMDLPGGFMEIDETLEQALYREVEEELGLAPEDFTKPVYVSSRTHDYEFEGGIHKNIVMLFCARLNAPKSKIKPRDDVAAVKFYDVNNLDTSIVVSDEHIDLIQKTYQTLQEK